MTAASTTSVATATDAVHWVSARTGARLAVVSVGTFQRIAALNGVRTWHPRGMRHPRYRLDDVRSLILADSRPRASPPADA